MGSEGITADSHAMVDQIWAANPSPAHANPREHGGQNAQTSSVSAHDVALIEYQYNLDEPSEDDFVSQPRLLADLWAEPAARRSLGFMAIRKIGAKLTAVRINALPIDEPDRDLRWLCFGPQQEIDAWRSMNVNSVPALAAIAQWLEGRFMSLGGAMAGSFPLPEVYHVILECLELRQQQVLRRRVAGDTLEAIGADSDVTRERIRQIEHKGLSELALHIGA
jgi:hypothetical protein